jgi:hypothetical protein
MIASFDPDWDELPQEVRYTARCVLVFLYEHVISNELVSRFNGQSTIYIGWRLFINFVDYVSQDTHRLRRPAYSDS